jgi:prepilin-type N-terminal cleavage/methylation domain-containing protein
MNGSKSNAHGFALIEVMIALFIFAIFMAVFATTQGYNLSDSMLMREEVLLEELAQSELNKIIIAPPKVFNLGMTLGGGDTKPVEGYDGYERTIKWYEFKVPDSAKIQGKEEQSGEAGDEIYKKKIFETIKKNLEKLMWQLEVTIKNKDTGFTYTLSTFVMDHNAKVKIMGL